MARHAAHNSQDWACSVCVAFCQIILKLSTLFTCFNCLLYALQAMEMRCYHTMLHISYKDHVTNEEVRAKTQQAIGPHEDLLTIIKRCKLQWYGHVSHSLGLAKTILQATVKGGRRQGRGGGGKTTSGNGQAWSLAGPRGQWRTAKNRENWL